MSRITLFHDEQLTNKGTPKGSKGLCSNFKMDVSADIWEEKKEKRKEHKAAYRKSHLQK